MEHITFEQQTCVALAADAAKEALAGRLISVGEYPGFLRAAHDALFGLYGAQQPATAQGPAKPTEKQIKASITREALISFIDGKPYKTLKRHLTKHGLDARGYRERYGLPADYPTTSANYSAQRSALAKAIGLGSAARQQKASAEDEPKRAA